MIAIATGSPIGLRGLPDANDPMNLIRIMPAEGVLAHGSKAHGAESPPRYDPVKLRGISP